MSEEKKEVTEEQAAEALETTETTEAAEIEETSEAKDAIETEVKTETIEAEEVVDEKPKAKAKPKAKTTAKSEDKDTFAKEIVSQLYRKVKLIVDESELERKQEKEITEIDSSGKKKGSRWAWAVRLKNRIERLLAIQRRKETSATDFPAKITLTTQGRGENASVHLRISVYKTDTEAKPKGLSELASGTIPIPLTKNDTAKNWVPIVRKASAALKHGLVSAEHVEAEEKEKETTHPAREEPSDRVYPG